MSERGNRPGYIITYCSQPEVVLRISKRAARELEINGTARHGGREPEPEGAHHDWPGGLRLTQLQAGSLQALLIAALT